jgi:glutamine cyclotransferase
MSDGSGTLTVRDPATFGVTAEIPVKEGGRDLSLLNELECVGDLIYANVFQSNRIVQIDKRSGEVVGEIDGFQLTLVAAAPRDPAAVLNGIAFVPETGVLLLTGKLWPKVLAVRLVEPAP